jgi:hypothetical protein
MHFMEPGQIELKAQYEDDSAADEPEEGVCKEDACGVKAS